MKNISLFILLVFAFQLNAQNDFKQNKTVGFIENKGQLKDQNGNKNNVAKYLLNLNGLKVQLRNNGFSYDTYTTERKNENSISAIQENGYSFLNQNQAQEAISKFHRVDVNFLNTNPNPEIIAENMMESNYNYFITATPETGIKDVKIYGKITYKNIYPNTDLEFVAGTNKEKPVEYNFIVHPGANANLIKWKYEGSDDITLVNEQIHIKTSNGILTESIPLTYEKETGKTALANYKISKDGSFGFDIGTYNKNKTLIIDPVPFVDWCSYYGGEGNENLTSIVTDDSGYVYIVGYTSSDNNIVTAGAYQTIRQSRFDILIAKFTGSGKRIWCTYFGGTGDEGAGNIILDKQRNIYISGNTRSSEGLADSGAYMPYSKSLKKDNTCTDCMDAFIAMFDNDGQWKWGTYFGGESNDGGFIVRDEDNNIYLAGLTNSQTGIAYGNSHQDTFASTNKKDGDGFLVKFDDSCRKIIWSTYYGGKGEDNFKSLSYHRKSNRIYLSGTTLSLSNIATTGTYKSTNSGDGQEGFFVCFDTSGNRKWGSYYGGSSEDYLMEILVDDTNNMYLLGITQSTNKIATTGAHQITNAGERDCFLVKIDSNFKRIWGTYYGGAGNDGIGRMLLNDSGDIHLAISTRSYRTGINITTSGSPKPIGDPSQWEAVISKFSNAGVLKWGTYYGSDNHYDAVSSFTIDKFGNIYVVGSTDSENGLATSEVHQEQFNGLYDGYILRLSENCNNYDIKAKNIQDATCYGIKDGKATVELINALPKQKYLWSNGAVTDMIDSLSAGWYEVTVTDSRGCSMQDSIEIKEPVKLSIGNISGKNITKKDSTETYSIPSQNNVNYKWDITNGTIQSGQGTNSINVLWGNNAAGEVKAVIYTYTYCGDSTIVNVVLEHGAGINQPEKNVFQIYPNPASETIKILVKDKDLINVNYSITDNTGRVIEKGILENETRIDVRNLAAGIYFFSTENYRTKIVVVK